MSRYQYRPLNAQNNEIRLLYPVYKTVSGVSARYRGNLGKICADIFVAPDLTLEFELRAVSQDDEPIYTALSYVWGKPKTLKTITVNGCVFPITQNLEVALRHLQYDDIQPAIWIDAICINQTDWDEKNDQVPRMTRIYSNARNVLIWLGPGTQYDAQYIIILYVACVRYSTQYVKPYVLSEHEGTFNLRPGYYESEPRYREFKDLLCLAIEYERVEWYDHVASYGHEMFPHQRDLRLKIGRAHV